MPKIIDNRLLPHTFLFVGMALLLGGAALLLVLSAPEKLWAQPDSCPGGEPCAQCHQQQVTGVHKELRCSDCHGDVVSAQTDARWGNPADMANDAAGCVACHSDSAHIFKQAMTTRTAEKQFCQRSWGQADHNFFAQNCIGCHVTNCLDCHSGSSAATSGHDIQKPSSEACYSCHNGYFVGWDYAGRAPREDSVRYQRGPQDNGQYYLKMRPDIHAEAGMQCADCHTMQSLQNGVSAAKSCRDCHEPDLQVIEHSIPAHLNKLECSSCHAAWAAQDYATFYIRTIASENRKFFRVNYLNDNYIKSSYLKRQDLPPLGLNERGLVSPIRPQFLAYYSEMNNNLPVGEENRLMLAQWKAFAPHTIRRGTPLCNACHGNAKRFMLQPLEQRKYRIDLDGLHLNSFWRSENQMLVNGSFYPPQRFDDMSQKTLLYSRKYVEKWQKFLKQDAASCAQ
ncbi:MAG: selenite/tellurite reduction operon b-type cytochrome iron-sulfur cluster-binding subunit ExtO [Desulfuromonas sp.]|nr:selenite/tellurite reduction operon b-type cytochrome iron-sulfur cluster-binding subunit ExtO [Desulfuromonas sp.]